MKTKTILENIGYGLIMLLIVVIMTESWRNKVIGLFKSKPYIELSGNDLNISEFAWGYGMVTIGQFNGDFDKLDEKVYNLLKGKTGTCRVFLQDNSKDKYGKESTDMQHIGDINIDELNNFENWRYWQNDAGIRTLLYKKYFQPATPSPPIGNEPVTVPQETNVANNATSVQTYTFSINELYPTTSERADLDSYRYHVNGIIIDANFDAGAMKVRTTDGEELDIQFNQLNPSSAVASNLRLAIKPGNQIYSICARAGASTVDLVSAVISSSNADVVKDTTLRMDN